MAQNIYDVADLYVKMKSESEETPVVEEAVVDDVVSDTSTDDVDDTVTEQEEVVEQDSSDDVIEFNIGEETKKVPLSELISFYTEKQQQSENAGLPSDVLELKEQLIQKLDVMEKILSDNSDIRTSIAEIDKLMKQSANDEDWNEVAKLQYQRQSIIEQAEKRNEALRQIRQEKEQEYNQYNEAFFREQYNILEKNAPDLLKNNGLQKVVDFVSKKYDVPNNIVAEVKDAKFFLMAKDAMAYHDMKEKAAEVIKPIKDVPKVIRRSVGKVTISENDIKQSNVKALRAGIKNATSQTEKMENLSKLWLTLKS